MSGLAGQAIGLTNQSPTPIGGDVAIDPESKGSMENFIGFGLGATSYDPDPVDFDATDDTITAASDGVSRVAPEYSGNELSWPGVPPFNPLDLFANGEAGFLYDMKVAQTFQDAGGTVPAEGNGAALGYVEETSGHGYNALQATAGQRPMLSIDNGGRRSIKSTGAFALAAAGVDFTGATAVTSTVAMLSTLFDTGQQCAFSHGDNPFSTGGFTFEVNQEVAGAFGSTFGNGSGAYRFLRGPSFPQNIDYVVTMQIDPAGATVDDQLKIWVDGEFVDTSQYLTSGTVTNAMFALRQLELMSKSNNGGSFLQGNLYFACSVGRVLTEQERLNLEAFAASRLVVTPAYPITSYGHSRVAKLTPDYAEGSSFSTSTWDTTATSVDVDYVSTIQPTYGGFATVTTYVDGAFHSSTVCPAVAGTLTIALPAGAKRVQLCNGAQSFLSGKVIGTWITDATFNAAATPVPWTPGGLVAYGDSITIGQDSAPIGQNAWAMLVRTAKPDHQVSLEAWGTRSLHDDASTPHLLEKLVTRLAEFSPSSIWLAIGTNDYGLNKWGAATFGAAYDDLLTAIHAAMPSAIIYAQTPILRSDESENTLGFTLGAYRTQIEAAAAAHSAYTTLVDGTTFMTTASLVDGVHPTTAGHALYADAVKTILGIS